MDDFSAFAKANGIEYSENEPLCAHISFKLGGNAAKFVKISAEKAPILLDFLQKNGEKFALIGNGTNLLVRDCGYNGTVVKILPDTPRLCGDILTVSAGTSLAQAAVFAAENGLSGFEFAHGIPGSVGGAVVMNAGAYGGEIAQVLVSSDYCDKNGNIRTLSAEEHGFGYRQSFYKYHPELTVLRASFRLVHGEKDAIFAKMRELSEKRQASQPLNLPSAGSVFKRPEGFFAGKLIEDCGLKGYTIGGAQVSPKHAGFIVNTGNATCRDVLSLIEHIQKTVFERFGVILEREIKIFGEE